ncbi:MAG: LysM peptidoglycan-binding domain-containing protein, partial [Deltaproteobacteria bacterium]|nr:LysM peptidoglycan-binding domain-containing protein [Deltaproteobacteria bacterium]
MGPLGSSASKYVKICVMVVACLWPLSSHGAFLYKSYIIRHDRGQDILCDPYIVQKDDYVLKIFKQRGEIAHVDFPKFLRIFRRINPQIRDIDRILPGQHIFIPLKKLVDNSFPGQELGVVTIPFVTISDIPQILKDHSESYRIQSGDTISTLLARRFGRYGSSAYQEGLRILKAMNPRLDNVNLIYSGQKIWLPRQALVNQPWYESLFDSAGNLIRVTQKTIAASKNDINKNQPTDDQTDSRDPLARAATILDAKLYDRGIYYFPRPGRPDYQLNLARYPILELESGKRILIDTPPGAREMSQEDFSHIDKYWDVSKVSLPADSSLEQLFDTLVPVLNDGPMPHQVTFTDNGVTISVRSKWVLDSLQDEKNLGIIFISNPEERTPKMILSYLKNHGIDLLEIVAETPEPMGERPTDVYGQVVSIDAAAHPKQLVKALLGVLDVNYSMDVP